MRGPKEEGERARATNQNNKSKKKIEKMRNERTNKEKYLIETSNSHKNTEIIVPEHRNVSEDRGGKATQMAEST